MNQSRNSSSQRRYHIERNSQGENEIVIPYFEEETPSTVYHLQEEIRLLKKHNRHLEQHIDRMKQEYDELRQSIQFLDMKQKEHIKRSNELHVRYNDVLSKNHEMKNTIQILKIENEEYRKDMLVIGNRQEDWKKKVNKLKQQQIHKNNKICQLQQQIDALNIKLMEKGRNKVDSSKAILQIQANELKQQLTIYIQKLTQSNLYNQELQERIKELQHKHDHNNNNNNNNSGNDGEHKNSRLIMRLNEQKQQQQHKYNRLKNKYKQIEQQLQAQNRYAKQLKHKIKQLQDQVSQVQAKLKKALKELQSERDTILQIRKQFKLKEDKYIIEIREYRQQQKHKVYIQQQPKRQKDNQKDNNNSNNDGFDERPYLQKIQSSKLQNLRLEELIKETQNSNKALEEQVCILRQRLQQADKDINVWKTKYQSISINQSSQPTSPAPKCNCSRLQQLLNKCKQQLQLKIKYIQDNQHKYKQINIREKELDQRQKELGNRQRQVTERSKYISEKSKQIDDRQQQINNRQQQLQTKQKQLQTKQKECLQKQKQLKQKQCQQVKQKQDQHNKDKDKDISKGREEISFRKPDNDDHKSSNQLQIQYSNELQALRRLIIYKRYPQVAQSQKQNRIKLFYENKLDIVVNDYQEIQKELLLLRQELLVKNSHMGSSIGVQERQMYNEAIRKWQIAYEQLQTLFQAKLVSKDQQINLLNLKLTNRYQY